MKHEARPRKSLHRELVRSGVAAVALLTLFAGYRGWDAMEDAKRDRVEAVRDDASELLRPRVTRFGDRIARQAEQGENHLSYVEKDAEAGTITYHAARPSLGFNFATAVYRYDSTDGRGDLVEVSASGVLPREERGSQPASRSETYVSFTAPGEASDHWVATLDGFDPSRGDTLESPSDTERDPYYYAYNGRDRQTILGIANDALGAADPLLDTILQ